MKRNLDYFVRMVREELRAEGPDGAGYSDLAIKRALNSALGDLAEVFPVRATLELTTSEGVNEYDLTEQGVEIENLLRVVYGQTKLVSIPIDEYLDITLPKEGPVRYWALWGNTLYLNGEVADDVTVKLWVTRAPHPLKEKDDIPEVPYYADEALIQYAVSACYRESKDYERVDYHYSLYLREKNSLLNRGVPQGQRGHLPVMNDSYWGPVSDRDGGSLARHLPDPGYDEHGIYEDE